MNYKHIVQGEFIERPNRFIAYVNILGRREKVHVKNTGRCRELLQKGVTVYLEKSDNPNRSTAYDLVAVNKGERLINMDSQAPNKVVEEWLYTKALFPDLQLVRPETTYGNSRFDFYVETSKEKIFIEVKGVTLEEEGVVRFPDAPSERAVKHVEELIQAKQDGYRVFVLFVVQMEGVNYFTPNDDTHAAFGEALRKAQEAGVEILAYDCHVEPDELTIKEKIPVYLSKIKTNLRIGELSDIPKPLLKWYDSNKRVLPWREEPTPYRVWVSEIMLQQTRVEAVKPYFERFMKSLPDICSLAYAKEEELLKLWEGLGYYNRVRNLQKAAIQIMEEYGGSMPAEYEKLLSLKGIGSYTAGAVSSIAFNRVQPAVDGNVLRVIARLRKDDRSISEAKVKASVEQDVRAVMPKDRPGDFNQAMMELGACICIPNGAPHCEACPLAELCMAHQHGTELQYPRKDKAKARRAEEKTVLVIRDGEKAAIRKRPKNGLLAGMYEFPWVEGHLSAKEVTTYLAEKGLKIIRVTPLEDAKHVFTHKEWHMKGYMVRVDELEPNNPKDDSRDWLYMEPDRVEESYPIPSAFAAYTKYLSIKLGNERYREEL
ncbi:MAG: DNA/RNA nuclease SfsA [Lachnospiraceae bacterium]|nr:DNA/RNA nuclease SfsA [Lachnospiraceae bacterium]